MTLRDRIGRRLMPRVIVALSRITAPRRVMAAAGRALGRRGVVRLYIAFDDPLSAIALLELAGRLERRPVRLIVEAIVARGIEGDPAREAKRSYALVDARRLGRRSGVELARDEPLAADELAFLAAWAAALPADSARAGFCLAALRRLWLETTGDPAQIDFDDLRPSSTARRQRAAVPLAAERRMKRRRLYETPVAVVAGRWYFAHERLDQIEQWLDELGWTATR